MRQAWPECPAERSGAAAVRTAQRHLKASRSCCNEKAPGWRVDGTGGQTATPGRPEPERALGPKAIYTPASELSTRFFRQFFLTLDPQPASAVEISRRPY
jgi:hypothetical protein